jgi:ATP-dependent helicase/nuclease subunit B
LEVFSGDILQVVQQGALILTVNKRLAKHLRRQYDDRLLAGGRGAWPAPEIFAFDGWNCACGKPWWRKIWPAAAIC